MVVNDGAPDRSEVGSLTLVFNREVNTFLPAFRLTRVRLDNNVELTDAGLAAFKECHNLHVLEEAINLYLAGSAGTRSRLEVAALLKLADLPKPLVNTKVKDIGHGKKRMPSKLVA